MDGYRLAATALVVGIIAPLFWLGVGVLENRLRRLLAEQVAKRKARRATGELGGPRRIRQ
jgi:hypothetical protein